MREMNRRKPQSNSDTAAASAFPRARKSRCAEQARAAELARLRRMSIEDRINEALSMSARLAWLQPTAKDR